MQRQAEYQVTRTPSRSNFVSGGVDSSGNMQSSNALLLLAQGWKRMRLEPIIRFPADQVTPPPILGSLFFELWNEIFSEGSAKDFAQFQFTSKWGFNLYWDTRRDFIFPQYRDLNKVYQVLQKSNRSQVTIISVANNAIDDFQVSRICSLNFYRLQSLNLENTPITDEALSMIASTFPNLRYLNLRSCDQLTDQGISYLVSLQRLEKLMIDSCRALTDEALLSIRCLKQLKYLVMSLSPKVLLKLDAGQGIEVSRERLPYLRELVGDCHVSALSGLKNLTFLDFGPFMSLTRASIKALMGLTKLTYLSIQQGQLLDAESVALIGEMKSLKALALNKIHFADNTHALTRLTNLQLLSLKSSTINDHDLIELARFQNLHDLDISNCHRITFSGLLRYQELIECRHFDEHLNPNMTMSHICQSAPLKVIRTRDCNGLKSSGYSCVESRPVRGHLGQILYWEDYTPVDI